MAGDAHAHGRRHPSFHGIVSYDFGALYCICGHEGDVMFLRSDYSYELPSRLIAQNPSSDRSASRLMRIRRKNDEISHHRFSELPDFLQRGDVLVTNDTRVVPARLLGKKETGGSVEVLIIDYLQGMDSLETTGFFTCDCLVKASRMPKVGTRLYFPLSGKDAGQTLEARVEENKGAVAIIRFLSGKDFPEQLQSIGRVPLPPYIKRREDDERSPQDKMDYQTVFARTKGAVAAPTAGLHFTDDITKKLSEKGVEVVSLTLHVGYGTFAPVKSEDIREHNIHTEPFSLPEETARTINLARQENRRIVAVGTTSVRTLEFCADAETGMLTPGRGMCDLYIYPGYEFCCVDAMITNFHVPESTLLMLVSAFYDREKILKAYETAIDEKYRFFSYGDAMFIE